VSIERRRCRSTTRAASAAPWLWQHGRATRLRPGGAVRRRRDRGGTRCSPLLMATATSRARRGLVAVVRDTTESNIHDARAGALLRMPRLSRARGCQRGSRSATSRMAGPWMPVRPGGSLPRACYVQAGAAVMYPEVCEGCQVAERMFGSVRIYPCWSGRGGAPTSTARSAR